LIFLAHFPRFETHFTLYPQSAGRPPGSNLAEK
jgi:hypothetical protein